MAVRLLAPLFLAARFETTPVERLSVDEPSPLALQTEASSPLSGRRLSDSFEEFTKERVTAVARNGKILLTFTNRVRLDFATTWVSHVRRLGMSNWMIGATDQQALEGLRRDKLPRFNMDTNLPQGEWPWGSPSFKALGPHKIELIYKCLLWDMEVCTHIASAH